MCCSLHIHTRRPRYHSDAARYLREYRIWRARVGSRITRARNVITNAIRKNKYEKEEPGEITASPLSVHRTQSVRRLCFVPFSFFSPRRFYYILLLFRHAERGVNTFGA